MVLFVFDLCGQKSNTAVIAFLFLVFAKEKFLCLSADVSVVCPISVSFLWT